MPVFGHFFEVSTPISPPLNPLLVRKFGFLTKGANGRKILANNNLIFKLFFNF